MYMQFILVATAWFTLFYVLFSYFGP